MSKFNPFSRRKDPPPPPPPTDEELRRQRQQNARQFFESVRQDPHSAPSPSDLPVPMGGQAGDLLAAPAAPHLPAFLDVAQELARARENGLFGGTVRQMRKEADAEAQAGEQVRRRLDACREVIESSEQALKAQNRFQSALYDGHIEQEQKAAELSRARLARLQAERELLAKAHAPLVPEPSAEPAPLPSVRLTDAQIEAMALRIVLQLKMEGDPAAAWQTQRAELYKSLPVNIAREVEAKVREQHGTLA